jgi:hypothetical protein
MKPDERRLSLSTDSDEAVRLFDRAVEHYLKYTSTRCRWSRVRSPPIRELQHVAAFEAWASGEFDRRGEYACVVDLLTPRQDQIRLLGGSNAQRDLFFQMLVDAAMQADRRDVVSAMIAHEAATRAVPPTERAGYASAARWLHS